MDQNSGIEATLAKIISYAFHPLVLPLVSLFLIFQLPTFNILVLPESVKWMILGMLSLATIAFPLLVVMLLMRKGVVRTLHMEAREERLYPYLVVCVVYYVMYLLFSSINLPIIVTHFILGVSILLLLVLIINFRWKISIHMIAVGGMTGAFAAIAIRYELNLIWLIVLMTGISGLIGFSRLKLNAHSDGETYMGWLIGAVVMLLVCLIF